MQQVRLPHGIHHRHPCLRQNVPGNSLVRWSATENNGSLSANIVQHIGKMTWGPVFGRPGRSRHYANQRPATGKTPVQQKALGECLICCRYGHRHSVVPAFNAKGPEHTKVTVYHMSVGPHSRGSFGHEQAVQFPRACQPDTTGSATGRCYHAAEKKTVDVKDNVVTARRQHGPQLLPHAQGFAQPAAPEMVLPLFPGPYYYFIDKGIILQYIGCCLPYHPADMSGRDELAQRPGHRRAVEHIADSAQADNQKPFADHCHRLLPKSVVTICVQALFILDAYCQHYGTAYMPKGLP